MSPLRRLQELGQSIWYDNIHRGLLESGELARLIRDDGLCGVTSNPTIFEKAINGSNAYDAALRALLRQQPGLDDQGVFFTIAMEDIQAAADQLLPVYQRSGHRDGMVSLEVSPELAYDAEATIREASALFQRAARPNVMIKVPATKACLPAIEALIADGVNVNVTLLFSIERYREVVEAYMLGLESRLRRGREITDVSSVASFFVSRVDTKVDQLLTQRLAQADEAEKQLIQNLQGKIAIANAKMAYQAYRELYAVNGFTHLQEAGAQTQRLLWGSTGTKNPAYSDVYYVESLIGPETVNTVPPSTYEAYKDHGNHGLTLTEGVPEARQALTSLSQLGIDLDAVTTELEKEGVHLFAESFHALLAGIAEKRREL